MGDIYPIEQTSQYLVARAARHRRAGRYDRAMMLLSKAKGCDHDDEEIEYELARTYDEMGCEDEASRAYLRVVRMRGAHRARALFQLTLSSMEHADLERAVSYFEALCASDHAGVAPEAMELLKRQLLQVAKSPKIRTRRQLAKALEQRAVRCLNGGKISSARRNIERSLDLRETARGHVLNACCHLLSGDGEAAARAAESALRRSPGYIQALCVLADAQMMIGDTVHARRTLCHAARRAQSSDALQSIAIECAKCGLDELTLVLTKRLLGREPFHIRALALRACAFANLGCMKAAGKIFARLDALMPQNSVYGTYYHMIGDGWTPSARLIMAQDIPEESAMERCMQLVSLLHADPDEVRADHERVHEICRMADWALRSEMAGANVTMIAVILLSVINTQETRQILFDVLTDPKLSDDLKRCVLQALCAHSEETPTDADLGGRFVRLAAGASTTLVQGAEECQEAVQMAASALLPVYPDSAQVLLDMWVAYLGRYGAPEGRMVSGCAAALEYAYHLRAGRCVRMERIARKAGVSPRLARLCLRRILRANVEIQNENQ